MTTTFEIFNDIDRGAFPTHAAETAIAYLGSIIGEFDIRTGRSMRISSSPDATDIDVDRVRWPRLSADINIVLTDRTLFDWDFADVGQRGEVPQELLGVANQKQRVALINTARSLSEVLVITHEIGHLYKLKNAGITKSALTAHCILEHCVMNGTATEPTIYRKPIDVPISRKSRFRLRNKQTVYSTEVDDNIHPFCDECLQQLGGVALLRSLAKQGKYVPPEMIS